MNRKLALVCCFLLAAVFLPEPEAVLFAKQVKPAPVRSEKSKSSVESITCKSCHEKFYEQWSKTRHGLAVQPFTPEFAGKQLQPQLQEIIIGEYRYTAEMGGGGGWVVERGSTGEKRYRIEHAMGGKGVFFFLTSLDGGRLQVLPLAFDVEKSAWISTPSDVVRHFIERGNDPQNWKDSVLTFNTACHGCHVIQSATNYDLESRTYRNAWPEPGIRCDACHGSSEEHVRTCREAPKGEIPEDLKIIRWKSLTPDQRNAACAPCHAKVRPLTGAFRPGDRYFDHYDLIALEDPDFYPDGRDRGENHTFTLWLMNPCMKSGKLDCLHCHAPGGEYRFAAGEQANEACLPCHRERVENASGHTNHPEGSDGNRCVACHMPKTRSGAIWRSDHSMLPPAPAATMAFQSPNACNLCHTDRDAAWADDWLRKRRPRDYQAPVLHRAGLVDAARKKDWFRLPEMLQYMTRTDRDEVTAVSLIRLLTLCDDERKWPVMQNALKDPSPFVRASAAEGLAGNFSPGVLQELLAATEDDFRVVRVRAAMALSGYPRTMLNDEDFQRLEKATQEFVTSLKARPDDWESHYNLGNFFLNRGHLPAALVAYDTAAQLEPRRILPLLNASIAAARLADMVKAEALLQKALEIEPSSPAANFHMALLRADQGDLPQAEKHFRATLNADPQMAEAACNLCVLLSKDRMEEALQWCRKAHELDPKDAKYAYTLAFFERRRGNTEKAIQLLSQVVSDHGAHAEAILLLGEIYEEQGKRKEATELLVGALSGEALSSRDRYRLFLKLQELESSSGAIQ